MSANPLEPPRLKISTARPSSVGGRLARQLRILSEHPQMPRLRSLPRGAKPGRLCLAAIRVTVALAILLAVAGGAGATALLIIQRIHPTALPPSEHAAVAASADNRLRTRHSASPPTARAESQVAAAPTPLAPKERPAPAPEPEPARPHRPSAERPLQLPQVAAPTPPPVRSFRSTGLEPAPALAPLPSTAAVAEEASLLRQALTALRQSKDGKRALELLGAYELRFPNGTLAPEASAARAQALLLTGDKWGALAVFDRLSLAQGGQAGELLLLRGELRSLAGRCPEALSDFAMVLRQTAGIPPQQRARALYGQASCRARTGDAAGAEQDRQRYLREYPDGPAGKLLRSGP